MMHKWMQLVLVWEIKFAHSFFFLYQPSAVLLYTGRIGSSFYLCQHSEGEFKTDWYLFYYTWAWHSHVKASYIDMVKLFVCATRQKWHGMKVTMFTWVIRPWNSYLIILCYSLNHMMDKGRKCNQPWVPQMTIILLHLEFIIIAVNRQNSLIRWDHSSAF